MEEIPVDFEQIFQVVSWISVITFIFAVFTVGIAAVVLLF